MDDKATNLFGTILGVIIVLLVVGAFVPDNPKCSKYGCDSDAMEGGSYCYSHCASNAWKSSGSSKSSNTSKTSTNNSTSTSKTGANNNTSTSKKTGTSNKSSYKVSDGYKSYDEGYEDVYENEDYDWDRYYSDDDYANGVDDAMDELDW